MVLSSIYIYSFKCYLFLACWPALGRSPLNQWLGPGTPFSYRKRKLAKARVPAASFASFRDKAQPNHHPHMFQATKCLNYLKTLCWPNPSVFFSSQEPQASLPTKLLVQSMPNQSFVSSSTAIMRCVVCIRLYCIRWFETSWTSSQKCCLLSVYFVVYWSFWQEIIQFF